MEKDVFTAESCCFDGTSGYTVTQFHDGEPIVKQFIPALAYEAFCMDAGIVPEIIG